MEVILASGSPRRKELLRYAVPEFTVIPADTDETLPDGIPAEQAAEYLAAKKAEHIAALRPGSLVIGGDTVVMIDGEILGKPRDEGDAKRMLKKLSGRMHTVVTGVCLVRGKNEKIFSESTRVTFYPLSDREIADYISTGEPMDKAGAYGIQGAGCLLVKGIDGDFQNVVGLPVARLYRELADFERSL